MFPQWLTSLYFGPNRNSLLKRIERKQFLIMTYDIMTKDIDTLKEHHWSTVILDEAQALKNPQSARTQSAHLLNTEFTLALTGTPIENSLLDLWSIMSIIVPKHLGTWKLFKRRFVTPVQNDIRRLSDLRDLIEPFLLRRQKSTLHQIFPKKIEINKIIPILSKETLTKLYDYKPNKLSNRIPVKPN